MPRATPEIPVLPVPPGLRAPPALTAKFLVQLGRKDHKEQLVRRDQQGLPGLRVRSDQQEQQDLLARKVKLGRRDRRALRETLEAPAHKGLREIPGRKAFRESKARLDLREIREPTAGLTFERPLTSRQAVQPPSTSFRRLDRPSPSRQP